MCLQHFAALSGIALESLSFVRFAPRTKRRTIQRCSSTVHNPSKVFDRTDGDIELAFAQQVALCKRQNAEVMPHRQV